MKNMNQPSPLLLTGLLGALSAATIAASFFGVNSAAAAPSKPAAPRVLLPQPVKKTEAEGFFLLTEKTVIHTTTSELAWEGRYLTELLGPATGFNLAVETGAAPDKSNRIMLALDAARNDLGDEGYSMDVTTRGVTITGAKPAGVFHGVQSLRLLLPVQIETQQRVDSVEWSVPCGVIEDQPRFRWRAYMLDTARYFRPKQEIKRAIDLMALLKMNVLQLHLSDNEGWRLEIKRYPKLVEVGSKSNRGREQGEGWFYSQQDIRELVEYAAQRHITIVPEIEMPGHAKAAVLSYPELGCKGQTPPQVCVSNPETFQFMCNVLDEVMELFPSPYIHVGADEVWPQFWRACKTCKPAMEKMAAAPLPDGVQAVRVKANSGLPFQEDIARLQGDFVRRIDAYLASKGRRMMGWDEVLEGGLKSGSPATVMAWRGQSAVEGAVGLNRDVIVALWPDYYLDLQYILLENTYALDPIAGVAPERLKHVLGVSGQMWGTTLKTLQDVDSQTFPRLCAIAEAGWTPAANRRYPDFHARLKVFVKRLEILGVDYRKPSCWTFRS